MAATSAKRFLELLQKSNLVETDVLKRSLAELKQKVGDTSVDFQCLSDHLIASELITAWQRDKLANGKFKGFFLGKYKLKGLLGTGGMSSVFLAEHIISGHLRAIKVLPRKKVSDESYLDRFYQEGKAAAAVDHPYIIRVYDITAADQETHYMVMEYAKGMDLHQLVKQSGPVEPDFAIKYVLQSAIGLQHAHGRGLVHRDIKPANILVGDDGGIKILDLGLALLRTEDASSLTIQHNDRVMGTADYLAPEQAVNSHNVDHRADIYSLGCTLYYLLTGNPPFPEGTLAERILAHQKKEPASILEYRPDCPQPIVDICEKMMRKKRAARFQNCDELMQALDLYRAGESDFVTQTDESCIEDSVIDGLHHAEFAALALKSAQQKFRTEDSGSSHTQADTEDTDSIFDAEPIPAPVKKTTLPEKAQPQVRKVETKKENGRRKRSPLVSWATVAVLSMIVTGLAYLLYWQQSPRQYFADSTATATATATTPTSNGADAQNHASQQHPLAPNNASGNRRASKRGGNAKVPAVVTDSVASKTVAVLRFEDSEGVSRNLGSLPIRSGGQTIGTLSCDSGCKLTQVTNGGRGGLLLFGNSKKVEFRPNDTGNRLTKISLFAKRQSADTELTFEIQVKSALAKNKSQRWQTVYRFDNDVNILSASSFTEIEISDLELGILEPAPQKFRFLLGGQKNSGVYIDDLAVQLDR